MKPMPKRTSRQDKDEPHMNVDKPQVVTKLGTCLSQKRPEQDIDPRGARKRDFIEAYKASRFNISQACRLTGLNRKTFYKWKNNDPKFLDDLKIAEYELKDYLKSKLLELVENGNLIATIFANKTIGQMVETTRQDIQISEGPKFDQNQLDALVRGQIQDRKKYNEMLGFPDPDT